MDRIAHRQLIAAFQLLECSADGAMLVDADAGTVLQANSALAQLLGRPQAALAGLPLDALGLWADASQGRHIAERLATGQLVHDTVALVHAAGGRTPLARVDAAPLALGGARCHVYHVRPLRGRAHECAELNATLETALVGIAFTRSLPAPRHFVRCNPVLEAMFGWHVGGLIGRPTSCLWPSMDAYEATVAQFEPALRRGESVTTERRLMRRDGSTFACLLRARVVAEGNGRADGTVVTFEDLTQRQAQEAALAAALRQAEQANRAKSVFVANLSHEIRNPLGALLGLAHLAHAPEADEVQRALYLRQILASTLMLKDLLDNTLDLAKMEAGMLAMAQRPFNLRALLDDLAATRRPVAAGKGLALAAEVVGPLPGWLVGDATRVRQILSNFVSNAIKFSPHGEVRLRCIAPADGGVCFQVEDQGPGIGAHEQARLFRRFVQLDEETAPVAAPGLSTGTGLGLSICRDLARHMGGEVGVRSQPGQGACFWLQLPLVAAPAPAARERLAAGPQDEAMLSGVRLLLVEDDEVNQMITRTMLQRWGAVAEVVGDGRSAVQRTVAAHQAGRDFHLVLMDLDLPELDGIEATRQIRQQLAQQAPLVVGLSASALQQDIDEALQAGMVELMSKPFDPPELGRRLGLQLQALRSPQAAPVDHSR